MTEEQKRKLQDLRSKNARYVEQLQWEQNVLLQDCFKALETYRIIRNETEINTVINIASGRDVKKVSHSAKPFLAYNHIYYIVWDHAHAPVIECNGTNVIRHWDDVIAVAFDTCFVDKEELNAILVRG